MDSAEHAFQKNRLLQCKSFPQNNMIVFRLLLINSQMPYCSKGYYSSNNYFYLLTETDAIRFAITVSPLLAIRNAIKDLSAIR